VVELGHGVNEENHSKTIFQVTKSVENQTTIIKMNRKKN